MFSPTLAINPSNYTSACSTKTGSTKFAVLTHSKKKIAEVARAIFEVLKKLVLLPTRYLGSKKWSVPGVVFRFPLIVVKRALGIRSKRSMKRELFGSGYHFFPEKKLSPDELRPYVKYALANASVHKSDSKYVEEEGFSVVSPVEFQPCPFGNIEAREKCFFDPKTGLKIAVFEKGDEVIVAFGALKSSESEIGGNENENKRLYKKGLRDGASNLCGTVPDIYRQACAFTENLMRTPGMQNKKITLSGQCLGGSLASYIALKHKLKAVCYNPLAMGGGLQRDIGKDALRNAEDYITS
ncbi:MAG: hypothetical protein ACE5GN_07270, partial [Waddliaceae bacterium]